MKKRWIWGLIVLMSCLTLSMSVAASPVVKIGVYPNEPFLFIGKDGSVQGFFADIITHIGTREGWTIEYMPAPLKRGLDWLQNGDVDILCTGGSLMQQDDIYENPITLYPVPIYYAVNEKKNAHLIPTINHYVRALNKEQNSVYHQSLLKWFGVSDRARSYSQEGPHELPVAVALILLLFAGNVYLGVKLRSGKKELQQELMDRRQVETALQDNEKRFRELAELLPETIYEMDEHGTLTFVNNSAFAQFGYTASEFDRGLNAVEMIVPEDRERGMRNMMRIMAGEDLGLKEYQAQRRDGSTFPALFHSTAILKNGESKGLRGFVIDISERKCIEDKLVESEKRLKTILDSLLAGIVIVDAENNHVVDINPAAMEMIGGTKDQILGRLWQTFLSVDDQNAASPEALQQDLSSWESVLITADGEERIPILRMEIPIVLDGRKHMLACFINMRRLKKAEEDKRKLENRLIHAQKMEAIGTLAGGIAHDFNNILFPILGYTEMMLTDVAEDSPLYHRLSQVMAGALRAKEVVRQILAFSRLKEDEMKPLKIDIILREVIKLSRTSLPATIRIHEDIQKDCGLVMANPTQIHQAALNLITNAYHAMRESGGDLKISLRERNIGEDEHAELSVEPGAYICFGVSDTGVGMDQVTLSRIFDPYYSTKVEGDGTGLGLTVIYSIVKSHGGYITVDSEPGKGTVFQMYLPMMESKEKHFSVQQQATVEKGNEHILLVDDKEEVVEIEEQMIRRLGYRITSCTSSLDALKKFEANPGAYDLVITDMTMPDLTGEQLAQKIIDIKADTPIVLCTGFNETISEEKAKAIGIKGYLMKPVMISDLATSIRSAIDHEPVAVSA